jgi:hypothetical protein
MNIIQIDTKDGWVEMGSTNFTPVPHDMAWEQQVTQTMIRFYGSLKFERTGTRRQQRSDMRALQRYIDRWENLQRERRRKMHTDYRAKARRRNRRRK